MVEQVNIHFLDRVILNSVDESFDGLQEKLLVVDGLVSYLVLYHNQLLPVL